MCGRWYGKCGLQRLGAGKIMQDHTDVENTEGTPCEFFGHNDGGGSGGDLLGRVRPRHNASNSRTSHSRRSAPIHIPSPPSRQADARPVHDAAHAKPLPTASDILDRARRAGPATERFLRQSAVLFTMTTTGSATAIHTTTPIPTATSHITMTIPTLLVPCRIATPGAGLARAASSGATTVCRRRAPRDDEPEPQKGSQSLDQRSRQRNGMEVDRLRRRAVCQTEICRSGRSLPQGVRHRPATCRGLVSPGVCPDGHSPLRPGRELHQARA